MNYFTCKNFVFKSLIYLAVPFLCSCAAQKNIVVKQPEAGNINHLKFINEYQLPFNLIFQNTTVGGLSGIDYDAPNNVYYLISDDRSHLNPARFYTANISFSSIGIDSVNITGVHYLQQRDGSTYPKISKHATKTTDPEAMRYNVLTKKLYWTSEGDRVISAKDTILIDPTISMVNTKGQYTDSIPLPANLRMQLADHGPRRNGVLEGLTFADNYCSLFVSMEEPMFDDGPQATLTENEAYVRIFKFDLNTKKNVAQYAYKLNQIPFPSPDNGDMNNGIPDILWLGNDKMLITERAYSAGRGGSNIKVFVADFKGASNIIDVASLIKTPAVQPVKKRLVVNMDDLGIYIDNIEGATFGPVLPNGHQSIVFVADNNFNPEEKAQFLLFEVIPD